MAKVSSTFLDNINLANSDNRLNRQVAEDAGFCSDTVNHLEDKDKHTTGKCMNPSKAAAYFRMSFAGYTAKARAKKFAMDTAKRRHQEFDEVAYDREYDPRPVNTEQYNPQSVGVPKIGAKEFNEIALGLGMQKIEIIHTFIEGDYEPKDEYSEYTLTDETIKEAYGREHRDGSRKSCVEWTESGVDYMAKMIAVKAVFHEPDELRRVIQQGKKSRYEAKTDPTVIILEKKGLDMGDDDIIHSFAFDSSTHELITARHGNMIILNVVKKED